MASSIHVQFTHTITEIMLIKTLNVDDYYATKSKTDCDELIHEPQYRHEEDHAHVKGKLTAAITELRSVTAAPSWTENIDSIVNSSQTGCCEKMQYICSRCLLQLSMPPKTIPPGRCLTARRQSTTRTRVREKFDSLSRKRLPGARV